jgi:hypothetical protein
MHIDQELINENGVLDQKKLDLVARLGGDWYGRINEDALFEVPKPLRNKGMGVDQLPEHVRLSTVLTGNHLGLLGNVEVLPDTEEVESIMTEPEIKELLDAFIGDETSRRNQLHHLAAKYLDQGKVMHAWKILLLP